MDEIGETILPDSEQSLGAKAAHIGAFIKTIVNDCYDLQEKEIFIKGLQLVDTEAESRYGKKYLYLSDPQRAELLSQFDEDARKVRQNHLIFLA